LIEAIIKLRDSPQLRESLGEAGRETVRVRNAASSFANAFAQVYRECVSSRERAQRKQAALTT
jgi:glycosyltransferase involved in cell wall biosynthesis